MRVQKKLLAEREFTLTKAVETAQSMELANQEDIRDVSTTGDESVNKVDKVATPRSSQGKFVSFFCWGQIRLRQSASGTPLSVTDVEKRRAILPKYVTWNVILKVRVMLGCFAVGYC